MKKLPLLAVVLAAVLLAVPSVAEAVDYGGVGGRPAHPQAGNSRTRSIFIYQLKPGQQTTDGVRVYNDTGQQRTIAMGAVDSVLASGGAFSCAQNADPKTDVGSWVKLQNDSVTLMANSNKVVPFTVTAPLNASVGEHDGCITIQDLSMKARPQGQHGVILGFRSAIRVVVTIPGKIVKKLALSSVTAARLTNGNYNITPTAQNEGNVSLDTNVQVRLASIFGIVTSRQGGTYPVLPHAKTSWNFELKHPFWGGWYRAHTTATYNSNPTAVLGQNRGASQTVQLASAVFFVPPSAGAATVEALVLLAFIAVVAYFVRRQRDVRHIREHWKSYVVDEGDTVTGLAKDHHTSWRKIVRVNKLKPPYNLHKGQKLKLPPPK